MKFNTLIPELSVTDIEKSKWFYIDVLGFELEYERVDEAFAFVSLEKTTQIMLEAINGYWETEDLCYPFGRGINFQIDLSNIQPVLTRLRQYHIPLFRDPVVNHYQADHTTFIETEFLVQDPDGYLLRFAQSSGTIEK